MRYLPLLLVPQIFPLNSRFSSPSALFIYKKKKKKKNCSCLFLMVLSRDLLYPAISSTSSFDFFSVLNILIILLMLQVFFLGLLSLASIHGGRGVDHNYDFQSVDFGVSSIFVGKDGLPLGECVFRQSYSFLYFCVASGVWSYCEAQVFKGALFCSFPFVKNVLHRNV